MPTSASQIFQAAYSAIRCECLIFFFYPNHAFKVFGPFWKQKNWENIRKKNYFLPTAHWQNQQRNLTTVLSLYSSLVSWLSPALGFPLFFLLNCVTCCSASGNSVVEPGIALLAVSLSCLPMPAFEISCFLEHFTPLLTFRQDSIPRQQWGGRADVTLSHLAHPLAAPLPLFWLTLRALGHMAWAKRLF